MKYRAKLKSDGTILVENVVTSSRVGLDMGTLPIFGVPTPVSGTDVVSLNYLQLYVSSSTFPTASLVALSSSCAGTDNQLSSSIVLTNNSIFSLSSSISSSFSVVNNLIISLSSSYQSSDNVLSSSISLLSQSLTNLSSSCAGTDNQIKQSITTLSSSITSSFGVVNASITLLSSSVTSSFNVTNQSITNLSSSISASFAQLRHNQLNNLGADDHTHYLHISGTRAMVGNLDVGGFNLTNFVTTSSLNIPLASGSSLTQIFSYTPDNFIDGQILTVGIRLIAWETVVNTVSGIAETEVAVQCIGSISPYYQIKGIPNWDKSSKGWPSTFDCAVTSSASTVQILARPGANAAKISTYVWHQSPITLNA